MASKMANWALRSIATGEQASFDEGSKYWLEFEASASQPDYAKLFLASGGPINTAAGAGKTDFSLTSSTAATHAHLHSSECQTVRLSLPAALAKMEPGKLVIDATAKLNVSSQRMGAAINGTPVDTHSGAGAVYLANLLRSRESHTQIPCVYGTLASHACTVGLSNVRVVDAQGEEIDVEFVEDTEKAAVLVEAEAIVDDWAHKAWDLRAQVKYGLSPALTKSVAKVPVGVNDKGYELVHNVVDQEFPFSIQTLNSLFEHTIGMELQYDADEVQKMLQATAAPGLRAAVWAQTIAGACSTAACYLVPYRADGRTVMRATGSTFEATESWLRTPLRTPCESNDCDGTALLALSMMHAAIHAPPEELAKHPFLTAVKNAVHPYYVAGVAVVGATSAEASGGGGNGDGVAGHALALMVPTLDFLAGLDRAATGHSVNGAVISSNPRSLAQARHDAVFNAEVTATLPPEEQTELSKGPAAAATWEQARRLQPYAIEGTTPASPVLYVANAAERRQAARDAELDAKALAQAAPNVGRSLKVLHVGGKHSSDPHRFYHDFVELSVHPSHPLYKNAALRDLGAAATQFVFARPESKTLAVAGCSPRQLVSRDFAAVPMYSVDAAKGRTLDIAAEASQADVIPPRAGPMLLTVQQSRDLRRSVAALKQLDAKLAKCEVPGHCVAYTFSYASLVNSPLSIEHFCEQVGAVAIAGCFDFRTVEGLALHPAEEGGEQAGSFVVANVVMSV